MDIFLLIANILLLISAAFSFIYGGKRHFKKGEPLFLQIVICAMGCISLGQLFYIVRALTVGLTDGFHVGMLGMLGCYFFLFSASFGQMDGLLDTKDKNLRKYKTISLSAPIVIIIAYIVFLQSEVSITYKVVYSLFFLVIAQASYYNLKHFLLPDVELGIAQGIRSYNLAVLFFTLVSITQIMFTVWNIPIGVAICLIINAFISGTLIIILERGVKKWSQ